MRTGIAAVLILTLGCTACSNRMVPVETPFAEAQALRRGDLYGHLLLDDGGRLGVINGRLLGPWVCGGARARPGDVCVETARVRAVEHEEIRVGPGVRVASWLGLLVMWIPATIWLASEHESDKEIKAATERAADERRRAEARAAERGEVLPPLPTMESVRLANVSLRLTRCIQGRRDQPAADIDILAGQVWVKRETCVEDAAEWFAADGQIDKARHLAFIRAARQRRDGLSCGEPDPGLSAPRREFVDPGADSWMEEYRAVVTDVRTYDYDRPERTCTGKMLGPEEHDIPGLEARARARSLAIASFPLTVLPPA